MYLRDNLSLFLHFLIISLIISYFEKFFIPGTKVKIAVLKSGTIDISSEFFSSPSILLLIISFEKSSKIKISLSLAINSLKSPIFFTSEL